METRTRMVCNKSRLFGRNRNAINTSVSCWVLSVTVNEYEYDTARIFFFYINVQPDFANETTVGSRQHDKLDNSNFLGIYFPRYILGNAIIGFVNSNRIIVIVQSFFRAFVRSTFVIMYNMYIIRPLSP
jgi:hypothetical protein